MPNADIADSYVAAEVFAAHLLIFFVPGVQVGSLTCSFPRLSHPPVALAISLAPGPAVMSPLVTLRLVQFLLVPSSLPRTLLRVITPVPAILLAYAI